VSNNVYANEADALEMSRPENPAPTAPTAADFPGSTPGPWREYAPEIDGVVTPFYRFIDGGDGCGNAEFGYHGFHLSGYIHESDARLMAAAPDLLALARQYASECGECDGSGLVTVHIPGNEGVPAIDYDDQPCPDCADIRAVIAKATLSSAEGGK